MKINGKTFIVTGGASGLGLETSRHLSSLGANIFIMDMNEENGRKVVEELGSDKTMFSSVDITLEDSVKLSLEHCLKKFKEIHGVINCAGIAAAMRVVKRDGEIHPLDLFTRVVMVNLIGTFNVIRLVADIINKQNKSNDEEEKGVFIMTASIAAFEGQVGQSAYSASKSGVVGMTLPMAREFATLKIRINTIAPGTFETPMIGMLPQTAIKSINDSIPFPSRMGKPKEYAFLCQHLIENTYINGEVIRLDGALRLSKL
ncbi:hypothetical protein RB653_010158 [Dictyostelium firmibasis]|uniref:3-hydroxyacyl-CoA dehydrogenase n=1 Tax=Dictyostelium firmibasis TaxID=79012 RepID=A0AAN7TL52_9MYCE